ncbi:hypothetical protein [Polaribacter sargassicola]|uniref:hypothetical protein n=1 Tax=Polaribacter sargassicola TaxID=2836891 RepID=UPI001F3FDFF5|nr:hypothetical protein [Polaribacter sp. DS7-9]MCG1036052.1 hypothetical protein [Polaribacter sp. DS7-9]
MKTYESFDDIEKELKKLALEKEIALEELKIVKRDFEDVLKPINWLNSTFKFASKYGFFMLLKKVFK